MMSFDAVDAAILNDKIAIWALQQGPRVGDFVIMPTGERRRFTYNWGDDIQTTWKGEQGSFYFGVGFMDYSGSLDSAIPKLGLKDTGEVRDGDAWFFHHNRSGAGRGVHVSVPCRVYQVMSEGG